MLFPSRFQRRSPIICALAACLFGAVPVAAFAADAFANVAAAPSETPFRKPARADLDAAQARLEQAKQIKLTLSNGRVLAASFAAPAQGKPTLLLLPGVNRNLLLSEPGALPLLARGFGVATFSLSPQPFSIAALAEGERPWFRDRTPTLESFAREAEAVAAWLRENEDAREILPVSLSYSGAFSPHLQGFPRIVDSVPMTSARAASPDAEIAYRCEQVNPLCWNPFLKPTIVRTMLDLGYSIAWSRQADSIIRQFGLDAHRRDDMIKGYTSLSLAAEESSWESLPTLGDARRSLILAGQESGGLMLSQIAAFERLRSFQDRALLIVVERSGHVVPAEHPEAYAEALARIAGLDGASFGAQGGVVAIDPQRETWTAFVGVGADTALARLKRRARGAGGGSLLAE